MLSLGRDTFLDEERLYIHFPEHFPRVEAWISRHPRKNLEYGRDWQLWIRKKPGDVPRTGKSPIRLSIESRLRAWLLARHRRPLFALRFEELRELANEEVGKNEGMSDVGH